MSTSSKDDIRSFLELRLSLKDDSNGFTDSEALFSSARLDSLDAMETVVFLEENFGLDFSQLYFELALIDSVDAIAKLIQPAGTAKAKG